MNVRPAFRFCIAAQLLAFAATGGMPAASAAPAQAAAHVPDMGTIDTDSDKRLDRHELGVAAALDFERLDADRDGYLTRAEFARKRNVKLLLPFPAHLGTAAVFATADADRDGKLDKREYARAVVAAYLGCDRNRGGTIAIGDLRRCGL